MSKLLEFMESGEDPYLTEFYQGIKDNNPTEDEVIAYMESGDDKYLSDFWTNAKPSYVDKALIAQPTNIKGSTNTSNNKLLDNLAMPDNFDNTDAEDPFGLFTADGRAIDSNISAEPKTEDVGNIYVKADNTDADFKFGAIATIRGMMQTGIDIADALGINVEEANANNQVVLNMLNSSIQDKDFFSYGTLGRMIPTLITLPVAYSSKIAGFAIEGALAYAESRGEQAEIPDALLSAAIAGGVTVGAMRLIDSLSGNTSPAATRALKYLKRELDLTDEAVVDITKKWEELAVSGSSMSAENKVKAIIDYAGSQGYEFKAAAEQLNNRSRRELNKTVRDRTAQVKALAVSGDIDGVKKALDDQKDFAIFEFSDFRAIVAAHTDSSPIKFSTNSLENIKIEFEKQVKILPDSKLQNIIDSIDLAKGEGITVSGLLDLYQDIGKMISNNKSSRSTQAQLGKAKDEVEKAIEALSPPEMSDVWNLVKDEYTLMNNLQARNKGETVNVMGKIISKMGDGKYSAAKVLDMLSKQAASVSDMAELMKGIGYQNQVKLEKAIASQILDTGTQGLVYADIVKKLDKIEMVTAEGKAIKEILGKMSEVFKTDDFINRTHNLVGPSMSSVSQGLTTDLAAKFKYFAAGRVFQFIMRNLDFTKEGVEARRLFDISKVLATPTGTKAGLGKVFSDNPNIREGIEEAMYNAKKDLEAEYIQRGSDKIAEGFQDSTKALPNIGGQELPASNKTIYSSQTGGQASESLLEVNSDQLIKRFVTEALQRSALNDRMGIAAGDIANETIDRFSSRIHTYLDDKRLTGLIESARSKLEVDNRFQNARVMANIIKDEADRLTKILETDQLGAKLPQAEREKVMSMFVEQKFKEFAAKIAKDCK